MMKLLNLKIVCCLWMTLSVAACHAAENIPLSYDVSSPAAMAHKLNMDNVYRALEANGKQYVAGFSIDAKRINHPLLVEYELASGKQKSWHFDDIIADIFIYNSSVSLLLDSGISFSLSDGEWIRIPLHLQPASIIVFSDGKQHLIACSPASLSKADTYQGGCESFNPDWKSSFSWHDIQPKVSGDYLYAVSWAKRQNQLLTINPDTGEVIDRKVCRAGELCMP